MLEQETRGQFWGPLAPGWEQCSSPFPGHQASFQVLVPVGLPPGKALADFPVSAMGLTQSPCRPPPPTHQRQAQITCTAIFIVWGVLVHLVIPPFVFMVTEEWDYIEGLYYSFITISTIGFGDFVAGESCPFPRPLLLHVQFRGHFWGPSRCSASWAAAPPPKGVLFCFPFFLGP